ncbi:DUF3788 domain-containing protein [Alkaliphilus serpentinus]|uniref:DUF3788 domain-containing protein n=1 Tax=Alkaliphilus serpentinus TaxID=1482731 RepID=A0A833HLJ2_9FIRM|nr:DUF3788 domain-containing protein [Alkaliphilus serpentinus]KAB3525924.1 DUF3788 domain-containing protein [Alkaliphilus serpentinus]
MDWNLLYNESTPPSMDSIIKYVSSELWEELNSFLEGTYKIQPKFSYSRCSMQPGWNVKYEKSGKSLCRLYPMEGFFIALVVIGNKESFEIELMLHSFSKYTQSLLQCTTNSAGGRWLMINVTEPEILEDVIRLVQIRAKSK